VVGLRYIGKNLRDCIYSRTGDIMVYVELCVKNGIYLMRVELNMNMKRCVGLGINKSMVD